jgi:DNA-binding NtrC family response regulator
MKKLLIVDDELGTRESLKAVFSRNFEVATAACASEALDLLNAQTVDLVMLDIMMPDISGLEALKKIQDIYPGLPVIMVTALKDVQRVVEACRLGAVDYIAKPFDIEEVRRIVHRALDTSILKRKVQNLQEEISREFPLDGIIGRSPAFLAALNDARKAAETNATILIQGESGTGKELLARYIHNASDRHDEPFVAVHCAALPEALMESELFGHEKGAFTHAEQRKLGRFDLAGSGTLFFDEVSEMSLPTQAKLLRVLQEREFMRVGGTQVIHTNARIIAASGKNLQQAVNENEFRNDLFYRLSVVPITLPPLRERTGDVALLAEHFLTEFRREMDAVTEQFAPRLLDLLNRYNWPGNVRELRNIVERMLVLHGRQALLEPDYLPTEIRGSAPAPLGPALPEGLTLEEAVNDFERKLVSQALQQADGVQTHAAELLGTTRRILRYRMDKLGLAR